MSPLINGDPSLVFIVFRAVMDLFWLAAGLCHGAAVAVLLVTS